MKTILMFCITIFISANLFCQEWKHPYHNNPKDIDITYYRPNPDTTVYHAIHTIYGSIEPISYFNFFPLGLMYDKKFNNPSVDFFDPDEHDKDETDTLEKMVLEINFYIPWTILRGRGQSKNRYQASRLTFDYWGQLRVSGRKSSPISPPTNSFGFTYDWAPWDNFRGWKLKKFREKAKEEIEEMELDSANTRRILGIKLFNIMGPFDRRNFWEKHDKPTFDLVTTQLRLMHYSNGQAPGFFVEGDPVNHNYLSGDFSTNYVHALLGYHRAWRNGEIFSAWGGYRFDFELWPGLFKFAPEQKYSYGQHRLLLNLQWVSQPELLKNYKKYSSDFYHKPRKKYKLKEYSNFQFRTETSWILGNLHRWRRVGKKGKKYRFSIKQIIKWNFFRNRNLGVVTFYYYGRDYHNIRFDNIVHLWSIGLNFKFNKNPVISFPDAKYIPVKSQDKNETSDETPIQTIEKKEN